MCGSTACAARTVEAPPPPSLTPRSPLARSLSGCVGSDYFKTDFAVLNPPEAARSYSSVWANDTVGTGHARSMLDSPQAWSARGGSQPGGEWMQIDLGIVKQVVGVAIQARGQFFDEGQQLVTGFTVQLSTDGISFWQSEVFTVDRDSLTDGWLSEMVIDDARWVKFPRERAARYVRIVVQNWEHHVSMRAGVLTPPTNQGTCTDRVSMQPGPFGPSSMVACLSALAFTRSHKRAAESVFAAHPPPWPACDCLAVACMGACSAVCGRWIERRLLDRFAWVRHQRCQRRQHLQRQRGLHHQGQRSGLGDRDRHPIQHREWL